MTPLEAQGYTFGKTFWHVVCFVWGVYVVVSGMRAKDSRYASQSEKLGNARLANASVGEQSVTLDQTASLESGNLGHNLLRALVVDRRQGSVAEMAKHLARCSELEVSEDLIRRELLLFGFAIADFITSQALARGALRQGDWNTTIAAYVNWLCALELKIPPAELDQLMRDRLPAYYSALSISVELSHSGLRAPGVIETIFARFCGLPELPTQNEFTNLCKLEIDCQLDTAHSVLSGVRISTMPGERLAVPQL
jgi:hypothetical protein